MDSNLPYLARLQAIQRLSEKFAVARALKEASERTEAAYIEARTALEDELIYIANLPPLMVVAGIAVDVEKGGFPGRIVKPLPTPVR